MTRVLVVATISLVICVAVHVHATEEGSPSVQVIVTNALSSAQSRVVTSLKQGGQLYPLYSQARVLIQQVRNSAAGVLDQAWVFIGPHYDKHAPRLQQLIQQLPVHPQLVSVSRVLSNSVIEFWDTLKPGGRWHPAWFIENQGHLVLEGLLVVVILYLSLQQSFKPSQKEQAPFTEREIDDLCEDWQPEPLWQNLPDTYVNYDPPTITSPAGTFVIANGKKVLNMTSTNFLGVAGNPEILEQCKNTIEKYGVGSCGPRGFYGTIDVHLELEHKIAEFMGTEESILYSFDLATVPSVLPAFANKKDLIICDEAVSYAIVNGCDLSRARILYFKHNDMEDLERVLKKIQNEDKKSKKPLNRRFIVVEGIYANYGDIAPLDEVMQLKTKYRYRLMVDESFAVGVLGEHGRGACEHFRLQPEDVEIRTASLGNAIASIGGFCAGEREIVDHQRLSGTGYCFSASLPPFLATAAIGALERIEKAPALLQRVRDNAATMRQLLAAVTGLRVHGGKADSASPLIHVGLEDPAATATETDMLLQQVVDEALGKGVMVALSRYSPLDRVRPPPSIRVAVTCDHSPADLQKAAEVLKAALAKVLKKVRRPSLSANSP